MRIAAVAFDLDGTLIDSEPVWMRCEKTLACSWGVSSFDPAIALELRGRPLAYTARRLLDLTEQAPLSEDEAVAAMLSYMADFYRSEVPWIPGALACLRRLRMQGFKLALVSSSYRVLLDAVLAGSDDDLFDTTIGGNEVAHAKPAPDPYLEAASRLGCRPEEMAVVEDSATGATAGIAAGSPVIVVGDDYHGDEEGIAVRVPTVADVTAALLDHVGA
ncbi:MAG: HAD family phosphatase [Actinomycetaceae bacterium]|nr:HAD family phosphatase [Actinomycetaceae bacterium]